MKKIWDESTDMGRLLIAAKAKFPHKKNFADISRHIDVTEAVLKNRKSRGIPARKIFELSDSFSCNPRWLATNDGDINQINSYGINFDQVSMEKIKYFKEKVIPMSEDEFIASKELSEQADRVAEITKSKKTREWKESGDDQ